MAEAPEVTLSWDVKNWVTVVLMVALGIGVLILGAQALRAATGGKINLAPQGMSNAPSLS